MGFQYQIIKFLKNFFTASVFLFGLEFQPGQILVLGLKTLPATVLHVYSRFMIDFNDCRQKDNYFKMRISWNLSAGALSKQVSYSWLEDGEGGVLESRSTFTPL